MKLTERVSIVAGGSLGIGISHEADCQVYLVDCGSELVLIDAGAGLDTPKIVHNIIADGFAPHRIKKILITHAHMDHAGGAADFQQAYQTEIICSQEIQAAIANGDEEETGLGEGKRLGWFPPDYQLAPCQVSQALSGNETLVAGDVSFKALYTPGHCGGHLAYLLQEGDRSSLFSGDLVFANGRILMEYLPGAEMWQYRQSVIDLAKLNITSIFPGHGAFSLQFGQDYARMAADIFRKGHVPPNLL